MTAPPAKQASKLWTRDFLLITLANLFIFLGFQMLMPVLPVYAKVLGGSEAAAGLVVGIFTVSAVLIRPFAGRALDMYGRRSIYLLGLLIFLGSVVAYIFVPTVAALLLFRLIHGCAWGAASTGANTIASDIIPKDRLGEGIGYFGLTSTLAMAVAPALGLAIVARAGYAAMFIASAAAVVLAAALAFGLSLHQTPPRAVPGALWEQAAVRPAMVMFCVTMTYGAVVAFIALYATHLGIGNIGPFFTVYAAALMLSRPLFGRLADRRGFDVAILPGLACVAATMLTLAAARTLPLFLTAGFIYGIGFGAVQPSLQAMALRYTAATRRGAANATFYTGFDLGIGAGSMLWGAVAQQVGYSAMYLAATIPAAAALAAYLLLVKCGLRHQS